MNNRERFHAVMDYMPVDQVPMHLVELWPDTLARWRKEGLPSDIVDSGGVNEYLGLTPLRVINLAGEIGPYPEYEMKVVAENDEEIIKTDNYGRLTKVFRNSTSMPEWIDFPVKNEDDLQAFLDHHYDVSNLSDRFADIFYDAVKCAKQSPDCVVMTNGGGFYWTIRAIAGLEYASYLLYDAPELVEDLFERILMINHECLRRLRGEGVHPDVVGYGEDLAYKTGTLLSREMFCQMMVPRYDKFLQEARGMGIEKTWYDSDGDLRPFMEDYISIGINCHAPCEVAANMDPVALRENYGKSIRMIGGFDKRIVAKGKDAIREEFKRLRPVIRDGGYIPAIDHSVSADISWDNYRYFIDGLKQEVILA